MSERDRSIGRSVTAYRERRDLSQQAVADVMRDRGWKWSQATLWATERGDRPLRLAEAVDLAEILGVHVDHLLERSPEVIAAEGATSDAQAAAYGVSLLHDILYDQIGRPMAQVALALRNDETGTVARAVAGVARAEQDDLPDDDADAAEAWLDALHARLRAELDWTPPAALAGRD